MITKNMVEIGYDAGTIRIIDSPNGDGAVCQIGDCWFYFGGIEAEETTVETYVRSTPKEDIIREIYETLEAFRTDAASDEEIADEYRYYDLFLKEAN